MNWRLSTSITIFGEKRRERRRLCGKPLQGEGVFCRVYSLPVAERAAGLGVGLEEAGRIERRRTFASFLEEWGGNKIALAHHRNDVAETMLYNLARGTGLAGLCSLAPVRENYIRPLLALDRAEIEAYLREEGQDWREDQSNASLEFSRNVIRHQVLPPLCSRINQRAVEHMAQASELLGEAEAYLRGQEEKLFERLAQVEEGQISVSEALLGEPEFMQARVMALALERGYGGQKRYRPRAFKKSLRTAGRGNGERTFASGEDQSCPRV